MDRFRTVCLGFNTRQLLMRQISILITFCTRQFGFVCGNMRCVSLCLCVSSRMSLSAGFWLRCVWCWPRERTPLAAWTCRAPPTWPMATPPTPLTQQPKVSSGSTQSTNLYRYTQSCQIFLHGFMHAVICLWITIAKTISPNHTHPKHTHTHVHLWVLVKAHKVLMQSN